MFAQVFAGTQQATMPLAHVGEPLATVRDPRYVWAAGAIATLLFVVAAKHSLSVAPVTTTATTTAAPPELYGHVHIAKTGGTFVNTILAQTREGVCGHKGYSLDLNNYLEAPWPPTDVIHRLYDGYNRGRVPHAVMDEIGYDDCRYISNEVEWQFWTRFPGIQLHVPCREPLGHVLSMCNEAGHIFNCSAPDLAAEVEKCQRWSDRFHANLLDESVTNATVKCYAVEAQYRPGGYVDYMGGLLRRKRVQSTYKRFSPSRNHKHDCILQQTPAYKRRIVAVLQSKWQYFAFCKKCMDAPGNWACPNCGDEPEPVP